VVNGCGLVRAGITGFWGKVMNRTPYEGLQRLLIQTYDAIRRGEAPPISFDEMSRTMRLVDRFLEERPGQ